MLDFLIDQLQGIVDSASSLFPLYFHIIEIISARSLFLLILELSNSEKKNALLTKLFSSLLQISGKNLIPKVKQYVQDIIQNTIMEPEIEVTRDILITILEFLSPDTKVNLTF